MSRIFGQAAVTIAWLGLSNKKVLRAFRYIAELTELRGFWIKEVSADKPRNAKELKAEVRRFADFYFHQWLYGTEDDRQEFVKNTHALEYLLTYDWFTRVWIKQEVVLSPAIQLVCGHLILEWCAFAQTLLLLRWTRLALFVVDNRNVAQAYMLSVARLGTLQPDISELPDGFQQQHSQLGSMLYWIWSHRNSKATDPRDKVFALVGLGSDGDHPDFLPNYLPSSTFQLLYVRVASHYLRSLGNHSILAHAGALCGCHTEVPYDPLLPSWVPDWRQAKGTTTFIVGFRASGDRTAAYRLSAGERCLTVKGRFIDEIVRLGDDSKLRRVGHQIRGMKDFMPDGGESLRSELYIFFRDFIFDFRLSAHKHFNEPHIYWTGHDFEEAYLRTLFCDRCVEQNEPELFGSTAFSFGLANELKSIFAKGRRPTTLEDAWPRAMATVLLLATQGKNWFISANGYIGWAPQTAQIGDRLAIIDGLGCAYTLQQASPNNYIFIGESYVHGFMDGEAVRNPDLVSQDIHLW